MKLPDEQTKAALLAAYQKELMALTPDMRREEMPIAEIQFKTNEMQAMIDVIRKMAAIMTHLTSLIITRFIRPSRRRSRF
mgnify:CR=1 FL=1